MKKNGSIVSEMMYHLSIAQKDKKQKQNEALSRFISDKKRDLQQQKEALILNTMDEILKYEKMLQIKVVTFYSYCICCAYFWKIVSTSQSSLVPTACFLYFNRI